jgi:hypothetical protein
MSIGATPERHTGKSLALTRMRSGLSLGIHPDPTLPLPDPPDQGFRDPPTQMAWLAPISSSL